MRNVLYKYPLTLALGLCALALAGCGGGGNGTYHPPPAPAARVSGTVTGAGKPIAGASVRIFAANSSAGKPATELGTGTTNTSGSFQISLSSPPADGQIVYVTASGGSAGVGANTSILLMTTAGEYCSGTGCHFPQTVTINELSTVFSAYSLAAFMTDNAGFVNVSGGSPGLPNAAKTFGQLFDASTGTETFVDATLCTGSTGEPTDCDALRKMDSLANYIAACASSADPATAACSGLFQQTGATDTLGALLNVATKAGVRNDGAGVYDIESPPAVYSPVLDAAPADWTLAIQHTGGGLYAPAGVAIDAAGNVWIADNFTDQNTGSVTELSPTGLPISPASGYTDSSLAGPIAIAVDQSGNVWVANYSQGGGKSVTEFDSHGNPVSGTGGYTRDILGPSALAVTPSGNIWVANSGNSSLTLLNPSGTPALTVSRQGGLAYPVGLALDSLGDIWAADQGGDRVSEFTADGKVISSGNGYTGGGISEPSAIAMDSNGNAWVTNHLSGLGELIGGNTPPSSCPTNPAAGDTGCPLSPAGGYTGGGLQSPASIAVDGANHIWTSNFLSDSLSEFSDSGMPLSPPAGYAASGHLSLPYGLAIDPSGNVWITNYAADSVTEFVGIASPVATPLIGTPHSP